MTDFAEAFESMFDYMNFIELRKSRQNNNNNAACLL